MPTSTMKSVELAAINVTLMGDEVRSARYWKAFEQPQHREMLPAAGYLPAIAQRAPAERKQDRQRDEPAQRVERERRDRPHDQRADDGVARPQQRRQGEERGGLPGEAR